MSSSVLILNVVLMAAVAGALVTVLARSITGPNRKPAAARNQVRVQSKPRNASFKTIARTNA